MSDPVDRARGLLDLGRPAEAGDLVRLHLASEPEDLEALAVLATALGAERDWHQAVWVTNRILALAPDLAEAHRMASVALQGDGQHEEAVRAAQTAVRLDPLDADHFIQLATAAHQVRSRRQEAVGAAQEAVRLAPYDENAHFAVGLTARRRRTQRAAYRRALALDPTNAPAANNELVARGRVWSLRSLVDGYLGVLGHDPGFEVAQANLVALTHRFVRRYYFAGFLLLGVAIAHGAITDTLDRGSLVRALVGVVAAVLMVVYAVRMFRAIPYGPRLHLWRAWRGRPLLIAQTFLALAVDLVGLYALVVPGGVQPATSAGVLVVYANVAVLVVLVVVGRVRRARR